MSIATNPRRYVISFIFIAVASIMLLRLFFLQNFEPKYKILANDIAIYKKVVYPPRGVIVDRKGKTLLSNTPIYDLMITPRNVPKTLDTAELCASLDIDIATYESILGKVLVRNLDVRQSPFMELLNEEQTARFQENAYKFPGFELVERNIRVYEKPIAGLLLGYIGEVSPAMLKKPRYATYRQGDYTGLSGIELQYEEVLRGQRGVHFLERDKFNRPRDPYRGGELDTQEVSGRRLDLYLDMELQAYAEKLMANKIGSVVAIDPQTGGILAMVSSPTFDPNLLRGKERAKNYSHLYREPTRPLFNRATQAMYPPGSTIKPFTGLVALNEGIITPDFGYPCGGGYNACRHIACEHHDAGHAANFRLALAHSCNSYFCHIFRMMVDSKKYSDIKEGEQVWHDYYSNFAYGRQTGVDIPFEGKGLVPDTVLYNKMYRGSWNSCTIVYVGMGQGELLLTPLQMANGMCIIANKGYYYTPHFVRAIGGKENDTLLRKYKEKHVVLKIPDNVFTIVQQAMQDVVDHGTAAVAKMDSIAVCAKTGTAENKAIVNGEVIKMQNHSMFVAFAPRENPRIAIAVAIENAGYGAQWAGPIAALVMEKYLKDSVSQKRKPLEERMMKANLINKYVFTIDSMNRLRDLRIYNNKLERKRIADSIQRVEDTILYNKFIYKKLKYKNKD